MKAIVLRRVDVGEADRILSLLTSERGLIDVRVPSARKSRKRFGGVDLYTLVDADVDHSRRVPRLAGATVLQSFPGIREDVVRLALAGRAAELVHQAAPEGQASAELFRLTEAGLTALDVPAEQSVGGRGWARAFELKLAHVLGVRPSLIRCAACGAPIDDGALAWSPGQGGVLVAGCRGGDPRASPANVSTLRRLKEALHSPLADQGSMDWGGDADGAQHMMDAYMDEHVGRRSKARHFLESVLRPLAVAALLLGVLPGCISAAAPTDVRLQGWLFDTDTPVEDASPISGATLTAFDDGGDLLGEGSEPFESAPGFYRLSNLPLEIPLHLEFLPAEEVDEAGEPVESGFVPTVRSGRTATEDIWVDDGVFHLRSLESLLAEIADMNTAGATFEDPDPLVDSQGGAVVGRVLESEITLGERLGVVDAEGSVTEVYYRVDGVITPGTGTDASGEFVLAGLPAGPVDVELLDGAGAPTGRMFRTRVVEDGVTVLPDYVP